MKKSLINLGVCAAILAIAGAFTTKGNTKVKTVMGWTRSPGTTDCRNSVVVVCGNTSTNICKTGLGIRTLYTSIALGKCLNKLHTSPE